MRIKSAVQAACLAMVAIATSAPAQNLPFHEVTANGAWDCRDPGGTFMGTLVIAEETYAWLKTDGRLGGYGKLHLLSFDTHLPNFAMISGPLKDEFAAGGGGVAGPRENYEDISGELFFTVAIGTTRDTAWYCTGRHAPRG